MDSENEQELTKQEKNLLIARFHRISKTIFEMLHDRGYLIFQEDLDQSLKKFKKNFETPEDFYILTSHWHLQLEKNHTFSKN